MGRRSNLTRIKKGQKRSRLQFSHDEDLNLASGDEGNNTMDTDTGMGSDMDMDLDDAILPRPVAEAKIDIKSLKRSNKRKTKKLDRQSTSIQYMKQQQKKDTITLATLKSALRGAEHKIHIEKKSSRGIIMEHAEQHEGDMKRQAEQHEKQLARLGIELEEAYVQIDEALNKAQNADDARIIAEARLKDLLRTERIRHSDALKVLTDKITKMLEADQKKASKDEDGMSAIIVHQNSITQKRIDAIVSMTAREIIVMMTGHLESTASNNARREVLENDTAELRSKFAEANKAKRQALSSSATHKSASMKKTKQLAAEKEAKNAALDSATEMAKQIKAMTKAFKTSAASILVDSHAKAKARHEREKLIFDIANEKATVKYLEDTMYY